MPSMANPMVALLSLQQAVTQGGLTGFRALDGGYQTLYDSPDGKERFVFTKIINDEVQVLAIFGIEDPIQDVRCYSVTYAVHEGFRGRGLAVEAVNKGIAEMKKRFIYTPLKSFFVDAIIDRTNHHSLMVAEKLFSSRGRSMDDEFSGTPSLYFHRLITLE